MTETALMEVMMMHNYVHPLHQHQLTQPKTDMKAPRENIDFKHVLSTVNDVNISKHAKQRLLERNIQMDTEKWSMIGDKMAEAKQKGVTDAVVILDDITFVVSTKNNTIITAMTQEETTNQIFTNINGTIVL